jgi:hypothetical protein
MSLSTTHGTYRTSDSAFLEERTIAVAQLSEMQNPVNSTVLDMVPEADPVDTVTHEWFDTVQNPLTGACRGASWDISATTGLGINDELAKSVQIGHVLSLGVEKVIVSVVESIGAGAAAISVQARGAMGSTAAIHADATAITIIGSSGIEGNLDVQSVISAKVRRFNHFQLFTDVHEVSVTMENQKDRSIDQTALTNARVETMERVRLMMDRALILGGRQERSGNTVSGAFGGISYFLNSTTGANSTNIGGAFTIAKLQESLREVQARGGMVDTLLCSPSLKAVFNDLNVDNTRYTRTETVAGQQVNVYDSIIGPIRIVSSNNITDASGEAYILNTRRIGKMWFKNDSLRFVEETNVNSRVYRESLQGQMSFFMKNITVDHALLFGITYA